jgi:DNA-binding NtrC family response regulator
MMENKKLSVFVVEDNIMFQHLIAKQLESISSEIKYFTNGEDCITELYNCKPDVIVLDNNLEGALTGLDTLKVIRMLHPYLYVVLFSTEKSLDTLENFLFYGHFVYVEKDITAFKRLKDAVCASEVYLQKTGTSMN